MKKISRDTPLMELVLRRYEKPQSLENRELVRKSIIPEAILKRGYEYGLMSRTTYLRPDNMNEVPTESRGVVLEHNARYLSTLK